MHYGIFVKGNSTKNGHPVKTEDDPMLYHYKDKDYAETIARRLNRAEGRIRHYVEEIKVTFKIA